MEWGQVASGSAVRVGSVLAQDPDAVEVTDLHGVREVMQDVAVEKRNLMSRLRNFFIFVTDEENERARVFVQGILKEEVSLYHSPPV